MQIKVHYFLAIYYELETSLQTVPASLWDCHI